MEKSTLEDNINEFLQERINESYTKISHNPEYKELVQKKSKIFNDIINRIKDEKLMLNYEEVQIDIYWKQLEQAYIRGFIDSLKIFLIKKM